MRNVVLWVGMSLDGFTSAENERLDWLVPRATQPEAHDVFQRLRERAEGRAAPIAVSTSL